MTSSALGFLFMNVDVTCFVHSLKVQPQFFSFDSDGSFDAHEPPYIVASFPHPGQIKQDSIERHRQVATSLFHDWGLNYHLIKLGSFETGRNPCL